MYTRDPWSLGNFADDHPLVLLFGALALLVALIGTPALCCAGWGGADGHHSCYVIAVEDQNNFTWDSTVVFVKTDPQASNEDKYCVNDSDVRKKLEAAARDKTFVVIHYRNKFLMKRWECNGGDSIIVGVESTPMPAEEVKR